ncbi:Fc.00g082300.m01.CDS01 [Cosmosporella sp. VM-42]
MSLFSMLDPMSITTILNPIDHSLDDHSLNDHNPDDHGREQDLRDTASTVLSIIHSSAPQHIDDKASPIEQSSHRSQLPSDAFILACVLVGAVERQTHACSSLLQVNSSEKLEESVPQQVDNGWTEKAQAADKAKAVSPFQALPTKVEKQRPPYQCACGRKNAYRSTHLAHSMKCKRSRNQAYSCCCGKKEENLDKHKSHVEQCVELSNSAERKRGQNRMLRKRAQHKLSLDDYSPDGHSPNNYSGEPVLRDASTVSFSCILDSSAPQRVDNKDNDEPDEVFALLTQSYGTIFSSVAAAKHNRESTIPPEK